MPVLICFFPRAGPFLRGDLLLAPPSLLNRLNLRWARWLQRTIGKALYKMRFDSSGSSVRLVYQL